MKDAFLKQKYPEQIIDLFQRGSLRMRGDGRAQYDGKDASAMFFFRLSGSPARRSAVELSCHAAEVRRCGVHKCQQQASEGQVFSFPAASLHAAKRRKWVQAMRRINVDGSTWKPTANSRVCSEHFISGEASCARLDNIHVGQTVRIVDNRCVL
ncbi:hypothetical protein HPB49_010486 [Dermacentor silvarum]|uniref:Uncharacterized protein n=1 Tax=Dermacentor silvarum TaxID=543639 RepID=A0ACB8DYS5_DERSI|nr:hypothetical protein HPB49_010486 [Dermacentor silvarum]